VFGSVEWRDDRSELLFPADELPSRDARVGHKGSFTQTLLDLIVLEDDLLAASHATGPLVLPALGRVPGEHAHTEDASRSVSQLLGECE
jgi:hypothetical protein